MRLLILAYDFPPNGSIGGQRPYSWFKYFKEFGIHPVVVTRHWDMVVTPEDTIRPCGTEVTVTESEEGTIIRVPFRPNLRDRMLLRYGNRFTVLRKALSLWFTLAQYFLPWADNRRNMLDAARSYFMENPCDAIIATGEPFILFRYAQMLSKEFGTPWVADYRDGWSTNYHVESSGLMDRLMNQLFMRPLEKHLILSSSLVTTAAPAFREELRRLHPHAQVEVVMNGYFHELFEDLSPTASPTDRPFTIAYSGTLYPYQKVELFLQGLRLLTEMHSFTPMDIQVVFLGLSFQPQQVERVMGADESLAPFLRFTDRMPHSESLQRLNEADMLLLLANRDYGQIYAKVFDYIAIGKPVLLCEDDHGPLRAVLEEAGTGLYADSAEDICAHLLRLMDEETPQRPDSSCIRQFSRKHQASVLAKLLKEMART